MEPETAKICQFFGLDPIQLIASGALLIAADPEKVDAIIENLKQKQIQAAIIGEFTPTKTKRTLILETGKEQDLPRPASDHLWKALGGR